MRPATDSLSMRRVRCSPSSTNSSAAATSPGDASSPWPSRSSTLDRPGHGADLVEQVRRPGTSSPVSTVAPSANSSVKPDRSSPPSRSRKVSAIATRSRCCDDLGLAALLAHLELDLAEQRRAPRSGTSQIRATATPSPVRAPRRSADAATPSAAAIANRALTPERWSTAGDSRSPRVSRATTSSRCSGTSRDQRRLLRDQRDLLARPRAGSACGSRRRTGP